MAIGTTFLDTHCHVTNVISFKRVPQGGWECEVELVPLEGRSRNKLCVILDSALQKPWGAHLEAEEEWTDHPCTEGSPIELTTGGGIGTTTIRSAPAETVRHNAAARIQQRDSMDSVPVLPQTAERMKAQSKIASGEFMSPRIPRPVHLDMDHVMVGNGSIPHGAVAVYGTPAGAMKGGMVGGALSNRRDSISSSMGARAHVTPQAHAAASRLLGAIYLGVPPQSGPPVEEQMAVAVSPAQLTSPSRPAVC